MLIRCRGHLKKWHMNGCDSSSTVHKTSNGKTRKYSWDHYEFSSRVDDLLCVALVDNDNDNEDQKDHSMRMPSYRCNKLNVL